MGKNWVDARFGDNWIEHTKEHYSLDIICELALKNGRKAIVLQEYIDEMFKRHPEKELQDQLNKRLEEVYQLKNK